MKIEVLIKLYEEPSIDEIILISNEYPLIIQQHQRHPMIKAGIVTNTMCDFFLEWLQSNIPDEQIIPTQEKRLTIYTNDSIRLVVNAMVSGHYTITIKKIKKRQA